MKCFTHTHTHTHTHCSYIDPDAVSNRIQELDNTLAAMFPLILGISSSNNKLYRLLYIRELNSHVNECPGGNLI